MNQLIGGLFNLADRTQMESLHHRLKKGELHAANVANSETPGYRALGYDFEEQLAAVANTGDRMSVKVSHPRHFKNAFTSADGKVTPDIYIKPTESVPEDGNTVDVDSEMVRMGENQILYRSAVEMINRKIGVLRYAINGGR